MKISIRTIPLVLLTVALLVFTACGQSDTATVTIDTGIRRQAAVKPISLFDRLFALLSFSTKAQADAPEDLPVDVMRVTVTGAGMDSIEEDIPLTTGMIILDVPAGSNRLFTVVAYEDSEGLHRRYGGTAELNLSPGTDVSVPVYMGQLPDPPVGLSNFILQEPVLSMVLNWSDSPGVQGYYVYRRVGESGPFVRIAKVPPSTTPTYTDSNITQPLVWHYYRVSAFNEFGEGDPSFEVGCMPSDC